MEKYVIWVNVPKDESDINIPKRYYQRRKDYNALDVYKGVVKEDADIFNTAEHANWTCNQINFVRLRKDVESELRFAEVVVECF
jgi:hypothetical protein